MLSRRLVDHRAGRGGMMYILQDGAGFASCCTQRAFFASSNRPRRLSGNEALIL